MYRFLDKESFFRNYVMISENAKVSLANERKSLIQRDQLAEQFLGNEATVSVDERLPKSPEIELEVACTTNYMMSSDEYRTLSEDDFFRNYAQVSYVARKAIVERKNATLTAADLISSEQIQSSSNNARAFH